MTPEDAMFIRAVSSKIEEKPELIGPLISALTFGATENIRKSRELACDMESLAALALNLCDKKIVSSKMKKQLEEIAIAKLEKHGFKTFHEWKWAVKEKEE